MSQRHIMVIQRRVLILVDKAIFRIGKLRFNLSLVNVFRRTYYGGRRLCTLLQSTHGQLFQQLFHASLDKAWSEL